MNKLLGKKNIQERVTVELKINDVLIKDPAMLASFFNDYFLNSVLDNTNLFAQSNISPSPIMDTYPIFELEEITEIEVKNIISELKGSKARDVYGLDIQLYKDTCGQSCKTNPSNIS